MQLFGQNSRLSKCIDSLEYMDIKEFNYEESNANLIKFESEKRIKPNYYLDHILFDSLRKDTLDNPIFWRKDSLFCMFEYNSNTYYRIKSKLENFYTIVIFDGYGRKFNLLTISGSGKIIDCIELKNAMPGLQYKHSYSQYYLESIITDNNRIIQSECWVTNKNKNNKRINKTSIVRTFELKSTGNIEVINIEETNE